MHLRGSGAGFSQEINLGAAVVSPRVWSLMFRNQLVIAARYSQQLHRILTGTGRLNREPLPFLELALVLVGLDDVASFVVNANHGTRTATS